MYAKVVNDKTKLCEVGTGTNADFYKSIGMTEQEVEQAYTGDWYLVGYAPVKPAPTKDEIIEERAARYSAEVDPITSHIARLRDEEQTPEVQAEINALIAERSEKVAQIQKELPYPAE